VANDGKAAEKYIKAALELLERTTKATYARFYDSTSAGLGKGGNYIPPSPADFVVIVKGRPWLLEVKSSEKHETLPECTLRSVFSEHQIMSARVWLRANSDAVCAFYSLKTKQFSFWKMSDISKAYLSPPRQRKLEGLPLATCGNNSTELAEILKEIL
jgi:hypothetical protein